MIPIQFKHGDQVIHKASRRTGKVDRVWRRHGMLTVSWTGTHHGIVSVVRSEAVKPAPTKAWWRFWA